MLNKSILAIALCLTIHKFDLRYFFFTHPHNIHILYMRMKIQMRTWWKIADADVIYMRVSYTCGCSANADAAVMRIRISSTLTFHSSSIFPRIYNTLFSTHKPATNRKCNLNILPHAAHAFCNGWGEVQSDDDARQWDSLTSGPRSSYMVSCWGNRSASYGNCTVLCV